VCVCCVCVCACVCVWVGCGVWNLAWVDGFVGMYVCVGV